MNSPDAVSDDEAEMLLSHEAVSTHACGTSIPLTKVEIFLQPTNKYAKLEELTGVVLQMMVATGEICQLLKEAKLEEALEGASMLVEMFPDKPKLQADLGGILFRMGEYDSAVSSNFISCITCSSIRKWPIIVHIRN